MKTPESLVPSLELCKEFARVCEEKGVKVPETYFYWIANPAPEQDKFWVGDYSWYFEKKEYATCLPAPTAGEIGEWLPNHIEIDGEYRALKITKSDTGWYYVTYYEVNGRKELHVPGEKLEDAVCQSLTYLIDQGLVTKLK